MRHTKQSRYERYNGVLVPSPASLKIERKNKYGSVEGLDDSEVIDPMELERQVILNEFKSIFFIPLQRQNEGIRNVMWNSEDFLKSVLDPICIKKPQIEKSNLDKLRDKLRFTSNMINNMYNTQPDRKKRITLKYLLMGWISPKDIIDRNLKTCAEWCLRSIQLQKEIKQLEQRKDFAGR